ncbi:MAG: hypothetical protein QM715_02110 [Nibricoccus sp.]
METQTAKPRSAIEQPWLWVLVACTAYIALCVFVLTRSRPPFFDEGLHLSRAFALAQPGSFRNWLVENDTSATGPLYALMHYALALGQGAWPTPWFRVPNLVLLAASILLIVSQLRRLGQSNFWACALTTLAMPTTWVLSGLALTEMPAQCGAAIACWAALRLGEEKEADWRMALVLILGVAVATMGRQTYLAALPGMALLAAGDRRRFFLALAAVAIGLVPLVGLVWVWGGLLPPKLAYMGDGGFNFAHVFYALAYVGVMTLFLAPGYYLVRWKIILPAATVAGAINLWLSVIHFTMLTSVQKLTGMPVLMHLLEATGTLLFVAAGVAFPLATLLEAWRNRSRRFWGYAGSTLGLCLACGAVTALFSSRYVGMTMVFLVPLLAPWMRFNVTSILRLSVGAGLGAGALYSYFQLG